MVNCKWLMFNEISGFNFVTLPGRNRDLELPDTGYTACDGRIEVTGMVLQTTTSPSVL